MPKKWTVLVNDKLDEKFRRTVFEVKGMHKGNLTEAVEEAMEEWIQKRMKEIEKENSKTK
jgi:hypothetical protein